MPEWTEKQIGSAFEQLHREYAAHNARLRVRRMLLEMATDAKVDERTGAWVPPPFDDSKLMLKTLIGDAQDVVQNYTARVSANEPQTSVIPVSLNRSQVGKTVTENAAEQERLLMSQWQKAGGRKAQRQVAWSQAWGRAGYYFTLPRDATWGLPDREYFDDLDDDEIEVMKSRGLAVITPKGKAAEPGETWMQRRRKAAQEQAISAGSLFTLEAYPPDMVLPRWDRDGTAGRTMKYGFIYEEIPKSEFGPGTALGKAAARYDDEDEEDYGLILKDGKIQGGVTRGGEEGSVKDGSHWILARFCTRDEIYYYVCETPGTAGKIIYHDTHGGGAVPIVPVPGLYTDGGAPGAEFASLMESVFALTPLINQLETLLSNVATWNGLGRYVVEDVDPNTLRDGDENPVAMKTTDMIGGHPDEVIQIAGKIRQLNNDSGPMLLQLVDYYSSRLDLSKPSGVTEGQAGASQAAWQVRQLLEASGELLEQAVENHAEAVKAVQLLWVRWMRMLDEPIYAFAAPGKRGRDNVRGLIELDPADLVETITVEQSSQSAQQRVVLRQSGIELLQAGRIDELEYYERYDLAADPEEARIRAHAQRVADIVIYGGSDQIAPDALVSKVVAGVAGRVSFQMLEKSFDFALATASDMAMSSASKAAMGNVAEVSGVRQPGLGMGQEMPGKPNSQAPQVA